MVGKGQSPRSTLLAHWGEERTYPSRSQMAKVELEEVFSETGLPAYGVLGNVGKMRSVIAYAKNRATMSSMMPIVPTFHTSERISGTPAA